MNKANQRFSATFSPTGMWGDFCRPREKIATDFLGGTGNRHAALPQETSGSSLLRHRRQSLQIRHDGFRIFLVHVVLRHRWSRGEVVVRNSGHQELDGVARLPSSQSCNVGSLVRPVRNRSGWLEGKRSSTKLFPGDGLTLLTGRGMTIATARNLFHEILAACDISRGALRGGSWNQ